MGHNGVVEVFVDRYHVKLVWPGSVGARETALQCTFKQCFSIQAIWSKQENCSKFAHCAVANQKQEPVIAMERQQMAMEAVNSLLRFRTLWDFVASLAFVGIFMVENILHAMDFEFEVNNMVVPAVDPLPYEFAVSLHMVHMIFGFPGAALVLMSGTPQSPQRTFYDASLHVVAITWTWWINRQRTLYELRTFSRTSPWRARFTFCNSWPKMNRRAKHLLLKG